VRLQNRVAIVTGGARGLGAGICDALAREGANVAIVDNQPLSVGRALADEMFHKYGQVALALKADVSVSSDVREAVDKVYRRWGKIDILVNNAGISSESRIEHITEQEWDRVIAVNLKGQFLFSQATIPYLKLQECAKIINMGSLNAKNGGIITGGVYGTSKGGVHSFTFALAKELAPYRICVNAVAPGPIDTDMMKAYSPEKTNQLVAGIPLRRMGRVGEVAQVILFLASRDADYITGEVIDINGGCWTD